MDLPRRIKGEVMIRCCFGIVAADSRNFSLSWKEMITHDAWRKAVRIEGGPFCNMPNELEIPF